MIKIAPEVTKKKAGNAKGNDKPLVGRAMWLDTVKRVRGRPKTGKAMSNAERQAKFKALKKALKTDAEWLEETVAADG